MFLPAPGPFRRRVVAADHRSDAPSALPPEGGKMWVWGFPQVWVWVLRGLSRLPRAPNSSGRFASLRGSPLPPRGIGDSSPDLSARKGVDQKRGAA
jgi:hypothetical protein